MTQTMHSDVGGSQSNRISVVFVRTDAEHRKCAYSQGVLCFVADVQKMCVHDGVTKGGILCVDASGAVPVDKFLQSVGNYNPATNVVNFYLSDGTTIMWDMSPVIADILASIPNLHVPATMSSPSSTINVAVSGTDNQVFSIDVDPLDTAVALVANGAAIQTLRNALDTDDQTATEVVVAPAVRGQSNVQAALETLSNAIPATLSPSGPAGGGLTGNYPNPGLNSAAVNSAIPYASDGVPGKVTLSVQNNYPQPLNDTEATTPAYVKAAVDAAIANLPGDKFLQGLQSYNTSTNVMTLLLNDGSTVPVDLTGLLNDAVATVPNKHVAATIASPNGSITTSAAGPDGQTFSVTTSAPQIPVTDGAGVFIATTVEDVLLELFQLIGAAGGIQNATQTPITDVGNNYVGLNVEAALAELPARITAAGALQTAQQTTIADAANYYTGASVEAALAELGAAKHTPATLAGNGSITIVSSGQDGQVFNLTTSAGVIPIVDAGNKFTSANVEGALTEIGQKLHGPAALTSPNSTLALTAAGVDNQVFTADIAPIAAAGALIGNATALAALRGAIDTNTTAASGISVVDAANHYVATDVEAALAEVGTKLHAPAVVSSPGATLTVTPGGADNQAIAVDVAPVATANALVANGPALAILKNAIDTVVNSAVGVSIVDTGNNFVATNVEAALAELAARTTNPRINARRAGNGAQTVVVTVPNVVTYDTVDFTAGTAFGAWSGNTFTFAEAGVYRITTNGVIIVYGNPGQSPNVNAELRINNTSRGVVCAAYQRNVEYPETGIVTEMNSSHVLQIAAGDTLQVTCTSLESTPSSFINQARIVLERV